MHTDMLPFAKDVTNPAYDFERTRYFGSADFAIFEDAAAARAHARGCS